MFIKCKELYVLISITSLFYPWNVKRFFIHSPFPEQINALSMTSLTMWMTRSTSVMKRDTCWTAPVTVRAEAGGSVIPWVSCRISLHRFRQRGWLESWPKLSLGLGQVLAEGMTKMSFWSWTYIILIWLIVFLFVCFCWI